MILRGDFPSFFALQKENNEILTEKTLQNNGRWCSAQKSKKFFDE